MTEQDPVNAFLKHTRKKLGLKGIREMLKIRPRVQCVDGLELSIQASRTHYCTPRNNNGPYSKVELGYPNQKVPEFMQWAEENDDPTGTVYGYVPVDVVCAVIKAHGGIKDSAKAEGEPQ